MKITGTIKAVMPVRTGVSSRGEWMSQSYWIEDVSDKLLQGCVFDVFGEDKIKQFNLQQGHAYEVDIDLSVRDYTKADGTTRYFNSLRAWRVIPVEQQTAPVTAAPAVSAPAPTAAPANGQPKPSAHQPKATQAEAMTREKEQQLLRHLAEELKATKERLAEQQTAAPQAQSDDLPF